MLQQTQVATVVPYFNRWIKAVPTIERLSRLTSTRLHKLWEGLGYYTRARNAQKAALQIAERHDGAFPRNHEDILNLSGIGRYTAGAISSIAFNQPKPLVDGNVIRVISRIYGIHGSPKDKEIIEQFWNVTGELVAAAGRMRATMAPTHRSLEFAGNCSMLNQSLMELGATICTPRNPCCELCPVAQSCYARKNQLTESLPEIPQRKKATARKFIAFIIQHGSKYYVRQRPSTVVNAHLWEWPNVEVNDSEKTPLQFAMRELGIDAFPSDHIRTVKHSITRFRISTEFYRVNGFNKSLTGAFKLLTRKQLEQLPFTSAHKRLIQNL